VGTVTGGRERDAAAASPRPRRHGPGAGQVLAMLAAFVVTAMVGGVLLAGLGMPAVGATGYLARNSVELFEALPSELATPPLSEGSTLLRADGSQIADFYEENRTEVKLDQIALVMRQAIVAIEDSRFYEHGGVDPKGLMRAAVANYASGTVVQGASTLTQQYVKNVLVESANMKGDRAAMRDATARTKQRKLQEIKLAISLEKKYTKDEILNRYLNIAYFGDRVYGVEAAARYYFGIPATKLTLPQAAMLAGLVQSPATWSPKRPEQAKARRDVVLRRMLDLKMINREQHDQAVVTPIAVTMTEPRRGCANAGSHAWYCDYVENLITKSPGFEALGKTQEERAQTLKRGGLTITTALDRNIANAAWDATKRRIPLDDPSNVSTATVTIEPGTGKILSIMQNKYYNPAGGRGNVATNFATDYQFGGSGGFQTGSTFKPFTLATWLKKGKSLNAFVSAEGGPASFSEFRSCSKGMSRTQMYEYSNSEGPGSGSMSVLAATYRSVNTAYVSMEKQLDLCDITRTAEDMGVHLASAQTDQCATGDDKGRKTVKLPTCQPSLTLGAKELSPMTMAAAYATFAAGGTYCTPIAVLSIKDRDGKPLPIPKQSCKRVLDKDVAAGVNYALQRVLTQGTARGRGIGRAAAGKTGTSNNSVDTWFVGYTPQRATAVWVGDPSPRKVKGSKVMVRKTLNYRTIDGDRQSRVYGATFAAPIWQEIMGKAHQGLPRRGFALPPGQMLRADKGDVPDVRSRTVEEATKTLEAAGFEVKVGGTTGSLYPPGRVADTTPKPNSKADKGSTVILILSEPEKGPPPPDLPRP
jgi:membrane peptidoglycan carboxypeptidase